MDQNPLVFKYYIDVMNNLQSWVSRVVTWLIWDSREWGNKIWGKEKEIVWLISC